MSSSSQNPPEAFESTSRLRSSSFGAPAFESHNLQGNNTQLGDLVMPGGSDDGWCTFRMAEDGDILGIWSVEDDTSKGKGKGKEKEVISLPPQGEMARSNSSGLFLGSGLAIQGDFWGLGSGKMGSGHNERGFMVGEVSSGFSGAGEEEKGHNIGISGSDTSDDEDDGGVLLKEPDSTTSNLGSTSKTSNFTNGGSSRGFGGNIMVGNGTNGLEESGNPEFYTAAAYQNILSQLQKMPAAFGEDRWVLTQPAKAKSRLVGLSGASGMVEEKLEGGKDIVSGPEIAATDAHLVGIAGPSGTRSMKESFQTPGGRQIIFSQPDLAAAFFATFGGGTETPEEELATLKAKLNLYEWVAGHDVLIRNRFLHSNVQGTEHRHYGNMAAHFGAVVVDVSTLMLGYIKDVGLLVSVYGPGLYEFLAAWTTDAFQIIRPVMQIDMLNARGSLFVELNDLRVVQTWGGRRRDAIEALENFRRHEHEARMIRRQLGIAFPDGLDAISEFEANEEVASHVRAMMEIERRVNGMRKGMGFRR